MRRVTLATSAAVAALGAVVAAGLAHDAHSWRAAIAHGDARFQRAPAAARWRADTWLPADPAARLLPVGREVALRGAVQAFVVAERTGRGFDSGAQRALVRSRATVVLSRVAAARSAATSSQANDLLGVLLSSAGPTAAGVTGDEQALAAFQAAVRADPTNLAAKYNLELSLRRAQPTGVRRGPGNGTGASQSGRRGAGSGTPGRGY
jgi:hypothetical protein